MKRIIDLTIGYIVALAVVLGMVQACAPKNLTPTEQKLFVAISVVDGIQGLQSAAIDANKLGLLNDDDSVQIVKFTKAAGIVAADQSVGWQSRIVNAWDELQKVVSMDRVQKSQTLRILWVSFATAVEQMRKGVV